MYSITLNLVSKVHRDGFRYHCSKYRNKLSSPIVSINKHSFKNSSVYGSKLKFDYSSSFCIQLVDCVDRQFMSILSSWKSKLHTINYKGEWLSDDISAGE